MYIWTVDHQILNLDQYTRVDVVQRDAKLYTLSAFKTPRDSAKDPYGTLIARFDNEANAYYARCLLFKSLMDHAGAWDASAIPLLSDEWENIKHHFQNEKDIRWGLLEHSEVHVTGLDEVTIIYSRECESQFGSNLQDYIKQVEKQLQDQLSIDVKWKVSDDIK